MAKAVLNESSEQHRRDFMCPESLGSGHSAPNALGHCTWCGKKIAAKQMRPHTPGGYVNNLDAAYNYFYNPDDI